ncbi:uncharacterized protein LOC124144698 [Haliotis rufescens]|uniref:uncharacterized protein LOC124144698 n=1 Tax=Haliotis rufescens TaxID=6454 RepID=UPI00201E7A4D|nr:uncharacterized protein LOC124144698 [Haliotis rufescens]
MRSRPATPCTPLSLSTEHPLTRRSRSTEPTAPYITEEYKYRKTRHHFQRLISENTSCVIKCVVVISLGLNVIAIPALVGVVFGPVMHGLCNPEENLSSNVCLPCGEDGVPGVDSRRTENGLCCVKSSNQDLQALLQNKLIRTSPLLDNRHKCEPDGSGNRRTKGRKTPRPLTLGRLVLDVKATKHDKEFKWLEEYPHGLAFIQGDLSFDGGLFQVLKGGIFRIRSHLSFDTYLNKLPNTADHIQYHDVLKKLPTGFDVLMTEKVTIKNRTYLSSDLDLTIKLRANDSVCVHVNTYSLLYNLPLANTFEIERISSS